MASDEVKLRDDGRWGGRLTSRPLPLEATEIDRLSVAERDEIAAAWLGRSATERRVGDAFAVIRDALAALGAAPTVVALAERAIDDEHRHAELCRVVASRYAGSELDPPPPLPLTVPAHHRADPELRRTLHVLGQCCFNETFASAVLEATLLEARGELAQAALRELLSDEIDHARIGWAHLASLPQARRDELQPWLLPLARSNLRMWREAPRPYPTSENAAAHGAMRTDVLEQALMSGIRDLVVPGLANFGLSTTPIEQWLAAGAPTGTP